MFDMCRVWIDGPNDSRGARRAVAVLSDIGCTDIVFGKKGEQPSPWDDIDLVIVITNGAQLARISDLRAIMSVALVPVVVMLENVGEWLRSKAFRHGAHDVIDLLAGGEEIHFRISNALETRVCFRALLSEREQLENVVARSESKLDESRLEITRRLGRAAEYRDNETGHHVIRVSSAAATTARVLNMPLQEIELIAQASPLHDIGKIGIPDNILLKPGPLSELERRIMKRHTVIGARILLGSDEPIMQTARQIALTHHERWDGSGYPRHLAGGKTPIAGRIVAVCDVFDALASKRPYKESWRYDEALEYIRSHSGTQFDPRVVGAFLEARSEILAITRRYAEPKSCGAQFNRYDRISRLRFADPEKARSAVGTESEARGDGDI